MFIRKHSSTGFTLIELLIVVAIIAILASVVFVALDPLKRFRDSRDSARWQDVQSLAGAIVLDQLDNGGEYLDVVANMVTSSAYMIVSGQMSVGCDDNNTYCDTAIAGDSYCVNLSALVNEGYLGEIPISPSSQVTWDAGEDNSNEQGTGYTLTRNANGSITVTACESESVASISVVR